MSYQRYRGSGHRDCNTNLKLNPKVSIVFHNLKKYDSHLIMSELDKFNVQVNVIPNGLEKYMSLLSETSWALLTSLNF